MAEKNILAIVEGARKEPQLLEQVFRTYRHECQIYSYNANIYDLYDHFQRDYGKDFDEDLDDLDFLLFLEEHEPDAEKRKIFDNRFTDIILIFDFDPQDDRFSEIKIRKMMSYFDNSTEQGRLYINYPMVESVCHIKSFEDDSYLDSIVKRSELGNYKERVNRESCCLDMTRYTKLEFSNIIKLNLRKTFKILGLDINQNSKGDLCGPLMKVLEYQLTFLNSEGWFYILNTCLLYLYEYYGSKMITWLDAR